MPASSLVVTAPLRPRGLSATRDAGPIPSVDRRREWIRNYIESVLVHAA